MKVDLEAREDRADEYYEDAASNETNLQVVNKFQLKKFTQ